MNHLPKAIQNIFREPKRKTSPQKIEPEIRQIKMCDSEAFTLKKYCRNDRSAIQALHFFFSKISFWGVTLCVLFLLSSPLNAENYVTVEGDSTRYSTFHDALSAGKGTALTLHGETISLGQGFEIPGISSVESHYSISIQADSTASGTSFVTLDANRKSSFLGGLGSTVNLNVKNVEFTNGREMYYGGAMSIYRLNLSGTMKFTENVTSGNGGALMVHQLTLTGDDTYMEFSENFSNSNSLNNFKKKNDIYIAMDYAANSVGFLKVTGKGTYIFGSGVETQGASFVRIQDGAKVTFGTESQNTFGGMVFFADSSKTLFDEKSVNQFNHQVGIEKEANVRFAAESSNTFQNYVQLYDTSSLTFEEKSQNTFKSIFQLNDSASVNFAEGSVNAFESVVQFDGSASVNFEKNSQNTFSNLLWINSKNVHFIGQTKEESAQMTLKGGIGAGSGVQLDLAGMNGTLSGPLVLGYDSKTQESGKISLDGLESEKISISAVQAMDEHSRKVGLAGIFRGFVGEKVLVEGGSNADALKNLNGDQYESILYSVQAKYDAESSNFIVQGSQKDVNPEDFEANTSAAAALHDDLAALFDVPDAGGVWNRTNGATGETSASAAYVQMNRLNYLNQRFASELVSDFGTLFGGAMIQEELGSTSEGMYAWGNTYYFGGNADSRHRLAGYDYDSAGLNLGFTWGGAQFAVGAFYGYGSTSVDGASSSLELDEHTLGILAHWNACWLGGYVTAIGEISFGQGDFIRRFDATYSSGNDTFETGLYLEKGWKIPLAFSTWNPYAAFQYLNYQSDSFHDSQLKGSKFDVDSFRSVLGIRMNYTFASGICNLTFGTAWQHEFLDADSSFIASTQKGSQTILGNGAGRDFIELTFGLGWNFTENVTLSGNYFLFFNEHSAMNAGMGTLTYKF